MKLPWPIALAVVSLAGCTVGETTHTPTSTQRVTKAVTSPLADLNLVREKIPKVLLQAKEDPYRAPAMRACVALVDEVQALDAVLGADLDVPKNGNSDWMERGKGEVGEAAFGALEGAAEGLVPYRGWVRKLTGAERYSKEVAAAIAAGIVRRAYLKGLGQSLGCEAPAAPLPKPPEDAAALYLRWMSAMTGA